MRTIKPPQRSSEMDSALSRAASTLSSVAETLPAEIQHDESDLLLAAFSSQAWQHLQAIMILCETGVCPGSALALFRPLVDAILRAQWLKTCASSEQIDRFKTDDGYQFPGFKSIADDLDRKHQLDGFFNGFKDAYSQMCDYTHSGYRQIMNHVSEQGIGPAYEDQMLTALVGESEKIALVHAMFVCNAFGHPEGAKKLAQRAALFPVKEAR